MAGGTRCASRVWVACLLGVVALVALTAVTDASAVRNRLALRLRAASSTTAVDRQRSLALHAKRKAHRICLFNCEPTQAELLTKIAAVDWGKMAEIAEKANKFYEFTKKGQAIYETAKAASEADDDVGKLRLLGTFLKASSEFLPENLKPIGAFLEFYGEAVIAIANGFGKLLDILAAEQRSSRCIFRPGAMSGGWELYNYFSKACMGQTLPKIEGEMQNQLKLHNAKLKQLTGTDAYQTSWLMFDEAYSNAWLSKPENWMTFQLMLWGYGDDGNPMCTCDRPEKGWDCPTMLCPSAPSAVALNPNLDTN